MNFLTTMVLVSTAMSFSLHGMEFVPAQLLSARSGAMSLKERTAQARVAAPQLKSQGNEAERYNPLDKAHSGLATRYLAGCLVKDKQFNISSALTCGTVQSGDFSIHPIGQKKDSLVFNVHEVKPEGLSMRNPLELKQVTDISRVGTLVVSKELLRNTKKHMITIANATAHHEVAAVTARLSLRSVDPGAQLEFAKSCADRNYTISAGSVSQLSRFNLLDVSGKSCSLTCEALRLTK